MKAYKLQDVIYLGPQKTDGVDVTTLWRLWMGETMGKTCRLTSQCLSVDKEKKVACHIFPGSTLVFSGLENVVLSGFRYKYININL